MSWLGDLWDGFVDIVEDVAPVALLVFGGYYIYTALEASAAVAAGMGVAEAEAAGISLASMAEAGLTASEAVAAGAGAESCLAAYTAAECYTAGIAASELMGAGASAVELLSAGATLGELAAGGATIGSLVAEGASAGELLSAGASVGELVQAGVGATEMLAGGASAGELLGAGLSVPEVVSGASALSAGAEHAVVSELIASGYTAGELSALGVADAAIVGDFTSSAVIDSLATSLAPGQTVAGLSGSEWAALSETVGNGTMNAYANLGISPQTVSTLTQVGYTPGEIFAAAQSGTIDALAADATEYLAWANGAGATEAVTGALTTAASEAATSAVSADLIALAESSADPIGTLLQGMGLGESAVAPEVIAAAEASADPIGALIAGIEAGGSGEAAVAAASNWTLGETALAGAGAGEVIAGNADKAAIYGDAGYGAGMTGAETAAYDTGLAAGAASAGITTAEQAAAAGWTAGEIAAAVAAGVILGPPIINALTGGGQQGGGLPGNQWYDIPVYKGGGLVNPGVNPGFIKPQPIYNPEGTPGINQYNWGAHGYAQNPEDLGNYDMYAPAQPYGNPNAQNLGRLITPDQIGYPSLQSASATQGTARPTYYNPVPQTIQAQVPDYTNPIAPVAPTSVPQAGHSLYIAPAAQLASTNTSGTMTPNQYTEYLNSLALEAGGQA